MSGTWLMWTNQLGTEIDDLLNDLDGAGISVNVVPGHVYTFIFEARTCSIWKIIKSEKFSTSGQDMNC